MKSLSADRLREIYHYCPDTGIFTRIAPTCGRGVHATGWVDRRGYVHLRADGHRYLAHRLAWLYIHGVMPHGDLDHANLNKSDNRIANLREATKAENGANKAPRAKSGFKGVVLTKHGWRAGITVNSRFRYLGLYDTPQEAHEAYASAARSAFGGFARMTA